MVRSTMIDRDEDRHLVLEPVMRRKRESLLSGRWCWIVLLSLTAAGTSLAQAVVDNSPPSNVEIIKLRWDKEVRLPRNFDPSVIPTGGTFSDPAARSSGPTGATASASTRGPAGNSNITFPATPGRLPVFYIYSLKVRNLGSQVITGIAWDYLFIDPKTNTELGRHQFLSYEKAAGNKTIALHAQLRSPPVRVIPASVNKTHTRYVERAVIECVLYADDSVWKNPSARAGVCELLKHEKVLLRHESAQ